MNDLSQKSIIVCENLNCTAMFEAPENFNVSDMHRHVLPCGHPAKCVTTLDTALLPDKHFPDDDYDVDDELVGSDERWLP